MKRKILSLILIGICSFGLISCENPKDNINREDINSTQDNRFINTGDKYVIGSDRYDVYYDRITNIVYLIDNEGGIGQSARRGITPLIGKDGLPMLLDEYNKTK